MTLVPSRKNADQTRKFSFAAAHSMMLALGVALMPLPATALLLGEDASESETKNKLRPPVIMSDSEIAEEYPPHGGVGMSTGYRYSHKAEDRTVHFRRRTLHEGAQITPHEIPWDQGYYVLEGEATITIDGEQHTMTPGIALYVYKGSNVQIVPADGETVSYILVEPVAEEG